jgi:alginate O-acetyltransferase complex protein AlgI
VNFVSFFFLALFIIALMTRLLTSRQENYLAVLLGLSLIFYSFYVPQYLPLLIFITYVDFYAGNRIYQAEHHRQKLKFLLLSLVSNLALLFFFKYLNFGLDNFRMLAGLWGWHPLEGLSLQLALPLGLSFFTFQSMSYTIDLYRGVIQPVKKYWRFLLFVSFFTHLVSGPIVRARELVYQFDRKRRPRLWVCLQGIHLMIRGFFLKRVVADNLAVYVNRYWHDGNIVHGTKWTPLILTFLFACQIFSDFEGYSSIALGSAYLLGFKLPLNFNCPYLASTFKDFWSRWHITLSHWMRDYLYLPLGGNRVPKFRLYLNLFLVMLVAGLWHGAASTFIIWGAIHGAGLVLERILGLNQPEKYPPWVRGLWYLTVQGMVLISWGFFRSKDLGQACHLVEDLFSGGLETTGLAKIAPAFVFTVPVALLHLRGYLTEKWPSVRPQFLEKAAGSGVMLYFILALYGDSSAFIYFQF